MFRSKSSVVALAAAFAAAFYRFQDLRRLDAVCLPNLADVYSPTAVANLPDGRYIFANEGNYYLQDAFGSASYTAYSNVAPGNNADPSFIAVWDSTHAIAGGGTFGTSDLYSFNPSSTLAPTFTANGLSLQNYSGVYRDANSLYVGGVNGTGSTHAISYVNLNTETTKVIIDNISTYSGGFARDAAGDLYVGDTDNGNVYEFTAAQLTLAISGSALSITNGTFVHQFNNWAGDGGGGCARSHLVGRLCRQRPRRLRSRPRHGNQSDPRADECQLHGHHILGQRSGLRRLHRRSKSRPGWHGAILWL